MCVRVCVVITIENKDEIIIIMKIMNVRSQGKELERRIQQKFEGRKKKGRDDAIIV